MQTASVFALDTLRASLPEGTRAIELVAPNNERLLRLCGCCRFFILGVAELNFYIADSTELAFASNQRHQPCSSGPRSDKFHRASG